MSKCMWCDAPAVPKDCPNCSGGKVCLDAFDSRGHYQIIRTCDLCGGTDEVCYCDDCLREVEDSLYA